MTAPTSRHPRESGDPLTASVVAPTLETARLILRPFTAADGDAHAAMLADADVMRHIGGVAVGREDAWRRMVAGPGLWTLLGYGYWAVERKEDGRFLGQVGFADFRRALEPSLEGLPEMGWMLVSGSHGKGYATEAVQAGLAWADRTLAGEEIVAIINPGNAPSINVALKAGFHEAERSPYKGEDILIFRR